MKYDEAYLYSRDIDWFCIIGDCFCHVASAGGLLPDIVNDRDKLRDIQKRVFNMDYIFEVKDICINTNYLCRRFKDDEESLKVYLSSFMQMSRKGFVSLDRTNLMDVTDNTYHVVCYPKCRNKLDIQDLPNINGDILNGNLVDIHLIEFFNSNKSDINKNTL